MATVIQIKRSTAATAPTTSALQEAEMAYAQDKANDGASAILYIESVNNDNSAAIHKVGGKYYTDIVDSATSAKTNNAIVKRDGSGAISADVTGDLTGNADTASAWETARTLSLSGDASGSASIDGSGNVDISVTVTGAEATSLAGDMTGDVYASNGTSKVLENGTDGTDATFTGDVTGDLTGNVTGDVTGNADTATALETARTIGGVSFDGSANIDLPGVNTAGNQDTSGNSATSTALATAINIGGVSFDGTIAITLPGVDAAGNQDTSGNAATATALETARAISTSGDATGTVNFDGSADADIALTLANSGVTAATYGSTTAVPVDHC